MGTSHQRGYVTLRGKQWYGYFRKIVKDPVTNEEKTDRIPVILGLKSKMSKAEAREALQREITKQLGQSGPANRIMNDGSVTFAWFVNNRFIPLKESVWKEETAKIKKLLIQRDLTDVLGDIPLVNFDKFSLQLHLNKLAATKSKDRVLTNARIPSGYLRRGGRSGLPCQGSGAQGESSRSTAGHRHDDLTWDQLRMALMELSSTGSHPAGVGYDQCSSSQ